MKVVRLVFLVGLVGCLALTLFAQQAQQAKKPGIIPLAELKPLVPANYFYSGQVAPVQLRNSVGVRLNDGKLVLAGLVDTSGYATDVAAKYQGFFITETKVSVEGTAVGPGQYGFGFTKDGKFYILDVGGNEVASVSSHADDAMKRPKPLQVTKDGDNYRLYAGKNYVTIKAQ